jgi:hypothetical protein
MTRAVLTALLLSFAALHASAYTLLDPESVTDTRPRWLRASQQPGAPERDLHYMLQWLPDRSMEIQFINEGGKDLHFNFQVEQLQPAKDGYNARVHIPSKGRVNLPLKIARFDQRAFRSQPRFWNVVAGPDTFTGEAELNAPRSLEKEFEGITNASASEESFFVYPSRDELGFNPQSLPYFVMKRSDTTAEVHFRNLSQHPLFFSFRVNGYQDATIPANPRVLLRPTEDKEVIVPVLRIDNHLPFALVEVFDVRADSEQGETHAPHGDGTVSPRLTKPHDWDFVATGVFSYDFNAWALGQRVERADGKIKSVSFLSLGERAAHFNFLMPQLQNVLKDSNPRVTLPAGEQVQVPMDLADRLAGRTSLISTLLLDVRVGKDEGRFAGAPSGALIPVAAQREGWLLVSTLTDAVAFSPRSVEYQIRPNGAETQIAFRNLTDRRLFFDWWIGGYQDPASAGNPRMDLAPLQDKAVTLTLSKSDLRIVLARLFVCNIRIASDEGALLLERK